MRLLTVGVSGNMVKVFHFTAEPNMSFILQPWQLLFMILAGWVTALCRLSTALRSVAGMPASRPA